METIERSYYAIDEGTARRAKEMNSYSDYVAGTKTNEYKSLCDEAWELVEEIQKNRPEEVERAIAIADHYAKKMAENMNECSRIGTRCPSILITGGSNFPVRKKEKQVAAWDRNFREFGEIKEKHLGRLRAILHGKDIIKSSDKNADEKLEKKIAELEEKQEYMRAANAWYRSHKTMAGFGDYTEETAPEIDKQIEDNWRGEKKPFASYMLQNNGAEIRRLKKRKESLTHIKEQDNPEQRYDELNLTVRHNTEAMRLQLLFDDKPEPEVREIVKSNGFRWARSIGVWQRQLTSNAEYACERMIKELKEAVI